MNAVFPRTQVFVEFAFELTLGQSHGVLDDRTIRLPLYRREDTALREWITALLLENANLVSADLGHFTRLGTTCESVVKVPALRVDIARDAFFPLGGKDLPRWESVTGRMAAEVGVVLAGAQPAEHKEDAHQYDDDGETPEEHAIWDTERHTRPPLSAWLEVVPSSPA